MLQRSCCVVFFLRNIRLSFFHCPPLNQNWILISWNQPSQKHCWFRNGARGDPASKRRVGPALGQRGLPAPGSGWVAAALQRKGFRTGRLPWTLKNEHLCRRKVPEGTEQARSPTAGGRSGKTGRKCDTETLRGKASDKCRGHTTEAPQPPPTPLPAPSSLAKLPEPALGG